MEASSGTTRRRKPKTTDAAEVSPSIWSKALTRNSTWKKPELLDVVHWLRQLLGIVFGIVFGFIPLTGFVGISSFCLLNTAVVYFYYSQILGVDDEDFGRWELTSEGFMSSFGLFLVTWVLAYNFAFFTL